MLSIRSISKSFNQRGLVLDNLNLEVNEGQTISIMGPSGSGKTTLMNIIGLLDKPDSGEVYFKGVSVSGYSEDESAAYRSSNIGFVFQEHLLLPYLTVYENIFLPLLASGKSHNHYAEKEQFINELMQKTGIFELKNKMPFNISGGEAQRAALVRALVNKPSILLADEPTGSLDSGNAENLGTLLLSVSNEYGIAVVIATHSADLAARMSQQLHLVNGKLQTEPKKS
jgi:lipoprotein-releasing system ATP-binding protein